MKGLPTVPKRDAKKVPGIIQNDADNLPITSVDERKNLEGTLQKYLNVQNLSLSGE